MSLENSDVRKIAHLARLAVSPEEVEATREKLSGILDLVAQMDALDTSSVEPMAHPMDVAQRLRPDVVTETNQREAFQAIAPSVEDGLYLVPKVIE